MSPCSIYSSCAMDFVARVSRETTKTSDLIISSWGPCRIEMIHRRWKNKLRVFRMDSPPSEVNYLGRDDLLISEAAG